MNKLLIVGAILVASAMPAMAQSSIKGIELSATDAARVDRQCDVLRFRQPSSLAARTPEPPPPGYTPSDSSSYWAEGADGMDEALSHINLSSVSIRDCREAGFYD